MQKILSNLSEPYWWFNILFSILLGLLIACLIKKGPEFFKSFLRDRKAKKLRRIKYERWCASTVQYQLSSLQARFLVFIFTCFTFISWLAYDPIKIIFDKSIILGIILTSPIYIMEIYWLTKDSYVKELIKRRRKLRIVSH